MQMQKKLITALVGTILIGAAAIYFLSLCLVTTLDKVDLLTNGITTTGIVVSTDGNDETNFPTIDFQTKQGQTQEFTLSVNSSYAKNDQVPVIYKPTQPDKATLNNFGTLWIATVFQLIIGLFFLIGTLVPLRTLLKNRWWFRHQRIMAQVVAVREIKDPGTTTYRLIGRWQDMAKGSTYTFESGELYFDPRPRQLSEVAVDIDPRNPQNYYVDQSLLSPKAEQVLKSI
jgi:hypothetical protein